MSPGRRTWSRASRWSATLIALVAAVACSDGTSLTGSHEPPAVPPSGSANVIGAVEGEVDAAGHVTFTPMGASPAPGVNAAMYGSQNVDVRLYNTPVVIDSTSVAGKKTWRFDVGVRNLLAHPIGTSQGATSPSDTLGITIFFTVLPTVTAPSPCSPCAVSLVNQDGTGNFTAVGQPYYYWHERLSATTTSPSTDTTLRRRTFAFTGDRQVTDFRFVVLVSAAWPPPSETRWKVSYQASTDSLPGTQASPPWRRDSSAAAASARWTPDTLVLTAPSGADIYLERRDSLAAAAPAYMEASLAVTSGAHSNPSAVFGLADGSRLATVGLSTGRVGFVSATVSSRTGQISWSFIGQPASVTGSTYHTYRVEKDGTTGAVLYVDGTAVQNVSYATLGANNLASAHPATALFGANGPGGKSIVAWSYVTYEIGASAP